MGINTKPQDDAKAMVDEYVKGVTIADIADKYNHSSEEVTAIVTNDATDEPVVTQADEDSKQTAKKEK